MNPLPALIETYLAGPSLLRKAVSGLSREQLLARPIAGQWSTLEVVCHLADFDPILADRMKRIISEERPALLGADEKRFAAALAYHDRDVEEELTIIELTRSQMGRIFRTISADSLKRVGAHSERGELTLERIITLATNHLPHHLAFIRQKLEALGLPA